MARSAGFVVEHHATYLPPLALRIWDVGLRPLSPVLIDVANGMADGERSRMKAAWIDTVMKFLDPLLEMELANRSPGGFHLFALRA